MLRRHRRPVIGRDLAGELGISLRTLYRDIATLQTEGAPIDGAPGLGYKLQPGAWMPPMMLSADELEALVLGARWVIDRADARLAHAAEDLVAKISAVVPDALRQTIQTSTLVIGPVGLAPSSSVRAGQGVRVGSEDESVKTPSGRGASTTTPRTALTPPVATPIDESLVREAIRREHKLGIHYRDASGRGSERLVWPIGLGYFDRCHVMIAWCELRQDFRHFRTDRIAGWTVTGQRYPGRRDELIGRWRVAEGVAEPGV